jgi:hypothetical protein
MKRDGEAILISEVLPACTQPNKFVEKGLSTKS